MPTSEPLSTPESTRSHGRPAATTRPPACRSAAGSPARGPRRTAAHSSAAPCMRTSACANPSGSPCATADLLAHQIEPGDALRDRMLDLEARVHLEEVEASPRRPAGTRPSPRRRSRSRARRDRRGAHLGAQRRRRAPGEAPPRSPSGGGAGSSTRARTGARSVAVRVAEDLDLDVARPLDVALEEQRVVAERGQRLARGRARSPRRSSAGVAHDPHALAAAARGRLDQHREADRAPLARRVSASAARRALIARHTGTPAASAMRLAPRSCCPCAGSPRPAAR